MFHSIICIFNKPTYTHMAPGRVPANKDGKVNTTTQLHTNHIHQYFPQTPGSYSPSVHQTEQFVPYSPKSPQNVPKQSLSRCDVVRLPQTVIYK